MRGRTRPSVAALVVALVGVLALGAGACSSDGGASENGTADASSASTSTTVAPPTDEEIIDNINEQLRPALDAAFTPEQVDCIISVLEEGGTGELDADEVVPEYDARCGVTVTRVTGVIAGATLVEQGATPEQGLCVADAIGKLDYDEVSALGEDATNAIYETCGIDIEALSGS